MDSRDPDTLLALFDDSPVLIGTAGDGRRRDAVVAYLTAVPTQPESFRWDWSEVISYHEGEGELGFAAFGEIVVVGEDGAEKQRAPIRVTIFAVRSDDGWRIREFHGSIPSDFS